MDALVSYAKEIIENAEHIAEHVILKKDSLDRTVYIVDMNGLDNYLRAMLEELNRSFREKVTTEMRYTDTVIAVQCCMDVVIFSKSLLKSKIPDKLKIAIFKSLNIIGFMFDRNRKSYEACNQYLFELLDEVKKYKNYLSPADLNIWNDSTGGSDQIPFLQGYLRGIMARIDS